MSHTTTEKDSMVTKMDHTNPHAFNILLLIINSKPNRLLRLLEKLSYCK